ncbi:MAG: ABC transporter substrate-binding protein [Halanaerobiales bacterium]
MNTCGKFIILPIILILFLSLSVSAYDNYNRSDSLIYGGGLWAEPESWNPISTVDEVVTGTTGLVYERLFHYYPLEGEMQPWLASSGEWVSDNVYEMELRRGVTWTDGERFDARDVLFTFELGKDQNLHYADIWDWLLEIKVLNSHKLQFVFNDPHYQEWKQQLYELPILPEHIWSKIPPQRIMATKNEEPVGTGSYVVEEVAEDYIVWSRNEDWWGIDVFGVPSPRYLINVIVPDNQVALGMLMKGELDLSNYFTPGVPELKNRYDLVTWYEDTPYMLTHNTAQLFMNTLRSPMDNPSFRRAMAFAINPDKIVTEVYENQVEKANSTGLFGKSWMEFYSQDIVEDYGFSYDPDTASRLLRDAGYKDSSGDGWRQTPGGEEIELDLIVPYGWTDWMEAATLVSEDLRAVGIKAETRFPEAPEYDSAIYNADFDLAINNYESIRSSNPYTYWNWVAYDNINKQSVAEGNFGRYNNPELFDLIDVLNSYEGNAIPAREAAEEIQKILLQEMPSVPLWHNGMWAQSTTENWKNWPTENNPTGYPSTWEETWPFGSVEMLIQLEKNN